MPYDRRGYYYRSVRDGDRVRRIYFGKGEAARLAAGLDHRRRSERLDRDRAWCEGQARLDAADVRTGALDELGDLLARAAMLAAGYHRHDRGAWRRRRMMHDDAKDGMDEGATDPVGHAPVRDDRPQCEGELRLLLVRAEGGDLTALPALRKWLDAAPEFWARCGDVARDAEAAWADLIAGGDLLVRESLLRKAAALKAELAGPSAPALERLLAERVAAGWMMTAHADAAVVRLKGKGLTIGQLDLMQRRQERTQRSYLAAIKALAMVRKLAAPAVAVAPVKADATGRPERAEAEDRDRCKRAEVAPATVESGRRRGRKAVKEPAGPGRKGSLPGPIRDRMRGLVGAAEEN